MDVPTPVPPWTAVVLDGGRASRLGSVDKPGLVVGGRSLRRRAVEAVAAAGAAQVLLVGPTSPEDDALVGARRVVDPEAYAGPLAALAAALPVVTGDVVVVLAADIVDPEPLPGLLLDALGREAEAGAVVAVSPEGRPQWLVSAYRAPALRRAVARLEGEGGVAGRRFADLLDVLGWVAVATGPVADVDTPEDLAAARAREQ